MSISDAAISLGQYRTIAIVSGKGGSGKTLFAASLALAMGRAGVKTILVDADSGTGGLSYFLGLRQVRSIQSGLCELLEISSGFSANGPIFDEPSPKAQRNQRSKSATARRIKLRESLKSYLQPLGGSRSVVFLPIGNHTDFLPVATEAFQEGFPQVLDAILAEEAGLIVFDCRGGIDAESVAVCRAVDAVLLVSETDAAAIQASQHLAKVLSNVNLLGGAHGASERSKKAVNLVGFIINKAFTDPTPVASATTSFFKARYLGAIPFDFSTTRRFIFGELPLRSSIFFIHTSNIIKKIFPGVPILLTGNPWRESDYAKLSMRDPDAVMGGRVAATIVLLSGLMALTAIIWPSAFQGTTRDIFAVFAVGLVAGLIGSVESLRSVLGVVVTSYFKGRNR